MALRFVAKYRCPCGESWKVRNTKGGSKNCESCQLSVIPYKKEIISKILKYRCSCGNEKEERSCASDLQEFKLKLPFCTICRQDMPFHSVEDVPRRMFGEFFCDDCSRRWFSGNAWPGKGQQCLSCKDMVNPVSLRPLRPSFGRERGEPHKEELCQKCQELGYNCKVAPSRDGEHGDDVLSVISQNSSTAGEADEDVTPVASDVEDQDELLEQLAAFSLS